MEYHDVIDRALAPFPDVFERLQHLSRDHAFEVFAAISNTYSPSLTARHTAGITIGKLLDWVTRSNLAQFHRNYRTTGNSVVVLGAREPKPIWILAHMDIISFLTGPRTEEGYILTPFCVPRASDGRHAAVALGNIALDGRLPEIAQGEIVVKDQGAVMFFDSDGPELPRATRVVYASRAAWHRETNIVTGYTDDAAGCAALVLAVEMLSHYPVDALVAFCDEEEGVVAPGPRAFSRGSDRLFARTPLHQLPDFVTVCDGQDPSAREAKMPMAPVFGAGAVFASFSSETKGAVTPPPLLAFERALAEFLAPRGIRLFENEGYTGRSDDVSAVRVTPNIAIIGYPGAFPHFADTPRVHLDDIVHLAKTLVVLTLITQSEEWQRIVLD